MEQTFLFFCTVDSMLLSPTDTTFIYLQSHHTHTYTCTQMRLLTFQGLPSPSRVCGVSFVTVMSSSERCQCKGSQGTVDKIRWSSVFFFACTRWRIWQRMQYHKFMVIEMAESFGGNAGNLIPRQRRSPYSICTQCRTRCDRETPESKRSYRGLTGVTTYPLHKSYLLITK